MMLPVPILVVRPSAQIDLSKVNAVINGLGYSPDMVLYADHAQAAAQLIEEHLPNLIIYVVEHQRHLDFISELKQKLHHDHFIAVIVVASAPLIYSALKSGIDSYILQEQPVSQMSETLKIALRGGAYLHADLAAYLLKQTQTEAHLKAKLDLKEQKLLNLFSQNLDFKEILKSLEMLDFQVHHMIRKIYQKISS